MEDLTVEQVETVHRRLMEEQKGDTRVISEANLFQMVFQANMIGEPVLRAAFFFHFLCAFPVFREGNTRTACAMTGMILANEGYHITGDKADLLAFARRIREFEAEPEDIENWLLNNTVKPVDPSKGL